LYTPTQRQINKVLCCIGLMQVTAAMIPSRYCGKKEYCIQILCPVAADQ
jgi:hypothetical protein